MKTLDVFLVPYWVEEILKQQGVGLAAITNYSVLKEHLSQESVIELLVFQELDLIHTKPDRLNGGSGAALLFSRLSTEHKAELQTLYDEALSRINNPEYLLSLRQKLADDNEVSEENHSPYQVIDMKGEDIALVVHPGYDRISSRDFYVLMQKVLKTYYMYETTVKVVSRPIFRLYVELMMRNRAAG